MFLLDFLSDLILITSYVRREYNDHEFLRCRRKCVVCSGSGDVGIIFLSDNSFLQTIQGCHGVCSVSWAVAAWVDYM